MGYDRRSVLQLLGAGTIGSTAMGTSSSKNLENNSGEKGAYEINTGEHAQVGNGKIETFLVTESNEPAALGVRFNADMLNGLPQEPTDGKYDNPGNTAPCCGHETVLDFPDDTGNTLNFQWFMLNWNPEGHPPPEVYTDPHFDLHFYLMDHNKRPEIVNGTCKDHYTAVTCKTLGRGMMPVPAELNPPDYVTQGFVEPGMGDHRVDLTAPEWNGKQFTHTFLYGAYDGQITFFEPMITKAFFESMNPSFLQDHYREVRSSIKLPNYFSEPGWYPTEYVVRYLYGEEMYLVSLESFTKFDSPDD